MSAPKWTPGPWRHTAKAGGWDAVMEPGGMLICSLDFNNPPNADLIAAAPELYAALEGFRLRPDAIVAAQNDELILRVPTEVIRTAAAALAKARGETP